MRELTITISEYQAGFITGVFATGALLTITYYVMCAIDFTISKIRSLRERLNG